MMDIPLHMYAMKYHIGSKMLAIDLIVAKMLTRFRLSKKTNRLHMIPTHCV